MASSASLSPSPRAKLHTSWRIENFKLSPQTSQNPPNFLIISTSHNHIFSPRPQTLHLSSPFPHNFKLPSLHTPISTRLNNPLPDSIDENFTNFTQSLEDLANLQTITSKFGPQIATLEPDQARTVFVRDPPWMTSLILKNLYRRTRERVKIRVKEVEMRNYSLLRRRQIKMETEAWEKMTEEYKQLEREMCEKKLAPNLPYVKKLAPNLPYVKKLFLGWFEPLRDAIEKEQEKQRTAKKYRAAAYAEHIVLLPADKMAVIVMHKMMALMMMVQDDSCVLVVQAAVQIGNAIEQEVRIQNFLDRTNQRKKIVAQTQEDLSKETNMLKKRVIRLIKRNRLREAQKLLKNEEIKSWSRAAQAKLGCRLIELLIETAYVQPPVSQSSDNSPDIRPAFRHIFKFVYKEPGRIGKKYGVIKCDPLVVTGFDRTAKHMIIPYVPMLVPPKQWKRHDKGGYFFLPSYFMRTHGSRQQQDALKSVPTKQMQKVYEALDTLGNTKWRVNKRVLSVVESIWSGGGKIAGLIDREDVPIPNVHSEDLTEIKEWRWSVMKAKKINQERHSLRCDTELKLSVAQQMRDEEGFYYPHNVDFRGRAYPMHPHLNHLSSDLCRGILEFGEGRPLGKSGLRWLKIHLANLYAGGVEKLSHDGRLEFVDNHLNDIFDSSDNPLTGDRWWLTAEDPFQCLAACFNLSEALKSSSPHNVISHLPIHQDGSCNGLQHYAALGRDDLEAAAVNLVAGEKPADVYSEIAVRVHNIMKRDSNKDPASDPHALLAKVLIGQVDRKLVKQTVMTSVYGVTYVGAREQIKKRLEEKGHITDDRMLFSAACYAAKVTLEALGELFGAARDIKDWLGNCAKTIAAKNQPVQWTTPLGLPVVQPYFKAERHVIRTSLQDLCLQRVGEKVMVRKQKTAFPPNFVHSLDGSHMMMTALACRDAGLRFAGVHDSFWTHACDVDVMNRILREKFVELYSMPILENLLESFETSYPTLTFPPLPERGNFDLRQVCESPYFFN